MGEDITAKYSVEELIAPVELRVKTVTRVAAKTDLGRVRENNEDKFEFYIPEEPGVLAQKGHIYMVCDGMGGAAAGQIASELACKTFIDVYLNHPAMDPVTAITSAVVAANRYVFDVSRAVAERNGMGTTLSGLVLRQDMAHVCQVGDSRVYRVRDHECEQITTDHTWIEDALRLNMIKPEEVDTHPYRHVITKAIGTYENVEPDVFTLDLRLGDVFMLCSDGLLNHVNNDEIGEILNENGPAEATWKLVGKALQRGGTDNCTVMVVRIDELSPLDENLPPDDLD